MRLGAGNRRFTVLVGDVHGCLGELVRLLRALDFDGDTMRLVFLGDLVDRGPDPVGVLRLVQLLQSSGAQVHVLLGNHEDKHLRYRDREQRFQQEGKPNLMQFDDKHKAEHAEFTEADFAFFFGLYTYLRFEVGGQQWLATHAGVPTDKPIEEQALDKLVRTRFVKKATGKYTSTGNAFECPPDAQPWYERWTGPEHVVFGHSVAGLDAPQVHERNGVRCYGLDTGCAFGGKLTAMVLDNNCEGGAPSFVQVKARQAYTDRNPLHWNE